MWCGYLRDACLLVRVCSIGFWSAADCFDPGGCTLCSKHSQVCPCVDSVGAGPSPPIPPAGPSLPIPPVTTLTQPDNITSTEEEMRRWCCAVGMRPEAASGWMAICRQPKQCCLLYIASAIAFNAVFAILYIGGRPWPSWKGIIPQTLQTGFTAIFAWHMFKLGPAFARSTLSYCLNFLITSCVGCQATLSLTGSDADILFQSRTLGAVVGGVATFFLILAGLTGAVAATHPARPHDSVRTPITEALLATLRIGNTWTDVVVARVMLQQARPEPVATALPNQPLLVFCGTCFRSIRIVARAR